ncbi:MAG: FIST C-terminal domain-containing protein [Treponema sp.]|nr:FIST C-terminal domain-containing protein [Treponema sp.]
MAIKYSTRKTPDMKGIINEIEQPDIKAVIYFFSGEYEYAEPHKALRRAFPQAACIGSSMIGGWCTSGAAAKGIMAMSFSSEEVEKVFVSFKEGVKKNPALAAAGAIEELKRSLSGHDINPNAYVGFIFFDGLCLGEEIIKKFTLDKALNMPFIGGAAADELAFTKTTVGINDKLSGDGLAVMIMKMKIPFYFNHYVHYQPTNTSFVITESEPSKRTVWKINGENAADYYAKVIGVPSAAKLNSGHFSKNPIGIVQGSTVYVRSISNLVDGSGLRFYCNIENETTVYLLKQGDIIANAQRAVKEAEAYLPRIYGAVLFNCVLRYLELQELKKVDAFNNVFAHLNFIGLNTYGEELFTHHNQTLTAIFFGGRR